MVVLWSVVQFSTIFVSSFAFLLITRIILGAGEGPSYSLAMTAASKWLPKEKRGIGISISIHWWTTWSGYISSYFNESHRKLWMAFGFYRYWSYWGYLDCGMVMDGKRERRIQKKSLP